MRRFCYVVAGFVGLVLANVSIAAITLKNAPGSSPQTAHELQVFAVPIAAVATDELGAPVVGLPVTFQFSDPFSVVYNSDKTFLTDAQGVATIPFPGLFANGAAGTYVFSASAPGALSLAAWALTIDSIYPLATAAPSGGNQAVLPGATFTQPFSFQVLGGDGAPFPRAVVQFAQEGSSVASGSFGGQSFVLVLSDANGVATAPPFTAGSVPGTGDVFAFAFGSPLSVIFPFTIKSPGAITLTPLAGSTPQTARPGQTFPNAVGVVATDNSNAPVSGVAVTFTMPGNWIYAKPINTNVVTVTTDANGVAKVPPPGIWAIADPGAYEVTASAAGAISALFELAVGGSPAAMIRNVSGSGQTVTGGGLSQPFVIQILDASGAPVPYPIAYFIAPVGPLTGPTASFNGNEIAVVDGDVNGFVASPPLLAGSVSGLQYLQAYDFVAPGNQLVNNTPMTFTIAGTPDVTLTPLAGTTPQKTRPFSFFPVPISLKATFADGSPAPGITVTFANPSDGVLFISDQSNVFDIQTGVDGIARPASRSSPSGYMTFGTGTTAVTASSTRAAKSVKFNLTVAGKEPTRLELLSGSGQSAQIGGAFAPWIVRAFDEDNLPVPYAAVQFFSQQADGSPAASFDDGTNYFAPADKNGVARSTTLLSNAILGTAQGFAFLDSEALSLRGPVVPITYTNVASRPQYGPLRVWAAPPNSIPVGGTTAIPYSVEVLDANGFIVKNSPVVFTTDLKCASFVGARTVTAVSDANGIATSPLLTGTHAATSCATSASAFGQTRDLSMHVFDPAKVVATVAPPLVFTHVTSYYELVMNFTEHGLPVHVTSIGISSIPSHGATYLLIAADLVDEMATLDFTPSQHPGAYAVQIITGSQRFVVPVVQVP